MSQIVEHTEINEHLEEIVENLIVEHLFNTISIATNDRTPGIFSTTLIVKRILLLGTPEQECAVYLTRVCCKGTGYPSTTLIKIKFYKNLIWS